MVNLIYILGNCVNGTCKCDKDFFGDDCSIYGMPFPLGK